MLRSLAARIGIPEPTVSVKAGVDTEALVHVCTRTLILSSPSWAPGLCWLWWPEAACGAGFLWAWQTPGDAERGTLRGRERRSSRSLGMYLNRDDPRQGLAGVGTTLDGNAQGGRTFLHADEGGRGLQEPGLQV